MASAPAKQMAGGAQRSAPKPRSFLVGTQAVIEGADYDVTYTVAAAAQQAQPWPLQATGWLRGLHILVQGTGITSGGSTTANGPFNLFSNIQLNDVNNEALFGPFDGYTWFLTNKFGGYFNADDPGTNFIYAYSGSTTANNFTFSLYIPLEIVSRGPLGPVASVNNTASLTVVWSLNTAATVLSGSLSGTLSVRIRGSQDFYWQPRATDEVGNPISQEPPASGTTQYWTQGSQSGLGGQVNLQLITGLGYPWRNYLFMLVASNGTRATGETNWPDPLVGIKFEANFLVNNYPKVLWQNIEARMWHYNGAADARGAATGAGLENGVYMLNFNADFFKRTPGGETRRTYLVTSPGSNFIFNGNIGSTGNTLYSIVNYVAPGGGAANRSDTRVLTGGD